MSTDFLLLKPSILQYLYMVVRLTVSIWLVNLPRRILFVDRTFFFLTIYLFMINWTKSYIADIEVTNYRMISEWSESSMKVTDWYQIESFIQHFSERSGENYRKPQIFCFPHPRTSQIIAAVPGFINFIIIGHMSFTLCVLKAILHHSRPVLLSVCFGGGWVRCCWVPLGFERSLIIFIPVEYSFVILI